MRARDDDVPAFPVLPPLDGSDRSPANYPFPSAGMSLRDYFAAKALPALIAVSADDSPDADIATCAYSVADAMLKARAA